MKRAREIGLCLVATASLATVMTGCSDSGDKPEAAPDLAGAHELCVENTDDIGVMGRNKLERGDRDTEADDKIEITGASTPGDFAALECMFTELDTPDSLMADLEVATAQDGSDSLDADGLHYAWSVQVDGMVTSYPALHMNITSN